VLTKAEIKRAESGILKGSTIKKLYRSLTVKCSEMPASFCKHSLIKIDMNTTVLTTCNNSFEANLIKGKLENNGISCFLANENISTLMPYFNGMLGAGVQIIIEDSDLEKAQEIIFSPLKESGIACPNCNSTNVEFGLGTNKLKKIFLVLISLFTWIPFGNIRNIYYCQNCKTEFKI
jgi:DNA-directed RNA polymerase subunit RPC12/RpoP